MKKQSVKPGTVKLVEDPIVKAEFYKGAPRKHNRQALKLANNISKRMKKTAACGIGGSSSMGGRGNTMTSGPLFYHPEYEPSSLLMPRDPIETNAWCRYFYKYDPFVSTAVDAHAELPISAIRLTLPESSDRKKSLFIKGRYEDMCSTENLDLFNKLIQVGIEHYKLGNVFPFTQWSEEKMMWTKMSLLDPDFVEIDRLQFSDKTRIDLRPNDRLKEVVNNGPDHAKTGILYQTLPPDVIELIATGKKIPLNTDPSIGSHVAHIAYKMSDYDTLGTGLIERNFKTLVYKDRLRQSQDAIAARHLTPKHLIHADNLSNTDVDAIREQVDNAFADPDYAIITNFPLSWDLIGTSQGLMQLSGEWEWITQELMIGLMINKSFLLGEGSFSNGQTVLEVMNQRYSNYRERLESFIITSLFIPMAKRNDWYEYEEGTIKKERIKKIIYPRIKWNRINLVDDSAHKQMMAQMATSGQIDLQTWLECFGLDAETVRERLERYKGTVLDVNNFEMERAIAAEVGRGLAPAITVQKAQEMGLEMPAEEGQTERLEDEGIEKISETREDREFNRGLNRLRKKKQKILNNLQVNLAPKIKPPRKDLKVFKAPVASENKVAYNDMPMIDSDKLEKVAKIIELDKQAWVQKLIDFKFDENSRRAAVVLEDRLIKETNQENRIKTLDMFIPQLFVSKIKTNESLMEKTAKAKERFEDKITDIITKLSTELNGKVGDDVRTILRGHIERNFGVA